jgi:hypothetical protein
MDAAGERILSRAPDAVPPTAGLHIAGGIERLDLHA